MSFRGAPHTDGADDRGASELLWWVVFGVEGGEPLHTRAAIFLVYKRVAHGVVGVFVCMVLEGGVCSVSPTFFSSSSAELLAMTWADGGGVSAGTTET